MSGYRILIVEDDPMVALDLEAIVSHVLASDVVISASVAQAKDALCKALDFALLDVDVLDGKTYAFATLLSDSDIPFAFVSASDPVKLPRGLRDVPFVAKPFTDYDIEEVLAAAGRDPGLGHA